MERYELPIDSDCYAEWVLKDQNMSLTYAKVTITLAGNADVTEDTDGDNLVILQDPHRLRLHLRRGQVTTTGNAEFKVIAIDEYGNEAKRRIKPDVINFW